MSRAQAIAAGAKRSLGAIVRIDEGSSGATPPPMPMMRVQAAPAADASTPITPGENRGSGARDGDRRNREVTLRAATLAEQPQVAV